MHHRKRTRSVLRCALTSRYQPTDVATYTPFTAPSVIYTERICIRRHLTAHHKPQPLESYKLASSSCATYESKLQPSYHFTKPPPPGATSTAINSLQYTHPIQPQIIITLIPLPLLCNYLPTAATSMQPLLYPLPLTTIYPTESNLPASFTSSSNLSTLMQTYPPLPTAASSTTSTNPTQRFYSASPPRTAHNITTISLSHIIPTHTIRIPFQSPLSPALLKTIAPLLHTITPTLHVRGSPIRAASASTQSASCRTATPHRLRPRAVALLRGSLPRALPADARLPGNAGRLHPRSVHADGPR